MKIGLMAMSGIRVCDQELLSMGLTLPGFVDRSQIIASLPSLGLLTLAGMTPKEHEIEYLEVPDIRMADSLPGSYDLVAISSYTAQIGEAYELAGRYREAGVPVVMGGTHVSSHPEEALEHCDSVVIGEGELSWPKVLADAQMGRLEPTYGSLQNSFNLNSSPMPAYELLDISKYNRLTVQTNRGCPHLCEFCASPAVFAGSYRQKPVERVVAEIDEILRIWEHPFIEFADDNSIVNKEYWRELTGRLRSRNVRWFTETDISVSEDEELLAMMRSSGCAQLLIGLESPAKEGLDGLETRNNWKYSRWKEYRRAIRSIQSQGISVIGCFILGLDGQGPEIFDQVLDFVRDTGLYDVQITVLTPFPGTPLYDRLMEEKRIISEKDWKKCTLFDVNFLPEKMSPDELTRGFRDLAVRLYSEEFTRWRRSNFRKLLRELLDRKKGAWNGSDIKDRYFGTGRGG